jgi:hypothetical protein
MLILYALDVHEEAPQIGQRGRYLSDVKVNAWREIIEACFQGERLSQGKNERYDFRVIPFVKGGDIIHMKGKRVIRGL